VKYNKKMLSFTTLQYTSTVLVFNFLYIPFGGTVCEVCGAC